MTPEELARELLAEAEARGELSEGESALMTYLYGLALLAFADRLEPVHSYGVFTTTV
jgi:hypothetical protein